MYTIIPKVYLIVNGRSKPTVYFCILMVYLKKVSGGIGHPKQILTSFGFVLLRTGGSPHITEVEVLKKGASVREKGKRWGGERQERAVLFGCSGVLYIRHGLECIVWTVGRCGGAESLRGVGGDFFDDRECSVFVRVCVDLKLLTCGLGCGIIRGVNFNMKGKSYGENKRLHLGRWGV